MEKKLDLRVQRTYKLLTDALMEMLTNQSFEEITVRELCKKAMVRPATFYKHFGDKYELFTFFVREKQEQFHKDNPFKNNVNYYIGLIEQTLGFMEENKLMVTRILKGNSSNVLIDLLSEQIEKQVCVEFKEDEKRGVLIPGKPEIMAPLFTGALVYTAKWWVLHDFSIPKENIIDECVKILKL